MQGFMYENVTFDAVDFLACSALKNFFLCCQNAQTSRAISKKHEISQLNLS